MADPTPALMSEQHPISAATAAAAASSDSVAASGSKRSADCASSSESDQLERRIRPRHFHSRPTSGAEAAEAAEHTASGSATLPRLYRHALESVFSFLSLRELHTTLSVSKDWRDAVATMCSIRAKLSQSKAKPLNVSNVCASRLARHIDELELEEQWSSELLRALADRLPHLRILRQRTEEELALLLPESDGLHNTGAKAPLSAVADVGNFFLQIMSNSTALDAGCSRDARGEGRWAIVFPASLTRLIVESRINVHVAARLFAALPPLQHLTELSLAILVDFSTFDLSPLTRLPNLRSLTLVSDQSESITAKQADALRSMPWLQRMCIPYAVASLPRLLRTPHELQWQSLSNGDPGVVYIDEESAPALTLLPSLTELHAELNLPHADWLQGLPLLVTLHLKYCEIAPPQPVLITGLLSCTRLTDLKLRGGEVTSEQMCDLTASMPQLTRLGLVVQPELDSLRFLTADSLVHSLLHLELSYCPQLPLADLRHLDESFDEPMDSYSQQLFTPPSRLIPTLRSFDYKPAELEED